MAHKEKILVTSALPYANGPLHLGHLAGAYLPADIYVRYQRLKGNDIVYICGSDEHGVPITIRADREGVSPKEIIDRFHAQNKRSFERVGMSFDNYSRTSLRVHHETGQEFFLDLHEKGILKKKKEKQFYDEEAGMFLPDRYVEGTCPNCEYTGARGDQCDQCGSDLNQTDLIDPISKISGKPPVLRETFHWYFPLGDFQERLREYLDGHPDWKENVKNYCYGWLKQGLRDRAVTRDLNWGIQVPLEEARRKVLYVWFEAVLGYISSTKEWAEAQGDPERWRDYWQDKNCRLVHFIGKDNIVFHAIMFPAILMARGDYALPDNVPANEFLNIEGDKLSKSRNYAVWLDEFLDAYPPDPLRYCLASISPETKDSDFSWKDFQTRNNSELVGILGNFVNRSLTFVERNFENRVPKLHDFDDLDRWILQRISEAPSRLGDRLEQFEVRAALKELMDVARDANKYFNDKEPWKTVRDNLDTCSTTLHICLQLSKTLAVLMAPFMPFTAQKLWVLLNQNSDVHRQDWQQAGGGYLTEGHELNQPEILFSKIEDKTIATELEKLTQATDPPGTSPRTTTEKEESVQEQTNLISIDDFKQVDLRVAKVINAERVEGADRILRLEVEVGQEERQIIAGVAQHVSVEDLPGKRVVIVANLKPATIRGLESRGMLLAAEDDDGNLSLVTLEKEIATGAKVR